MTTLPSLHWLSVHLHDAINLTHEKRFMQPPNIYNKTCPNTADPNTEFGELLTSFDA